MQPREIKERATQLFSKGKFVKAAEAFEAYCKADPRDVQARLRMGDAWAKAGKKEQAVGAYTRAAEGFAKDGFLPRAIAASKLILELDPGHQGVQKMLADLYARKSGGVRVAPATKSEAAHPRQRVAPVPERIEVAERELPPVQIIEIEVDDSASASGEQVDVDLTPSRPAGPPLPLASSPSVGPTELERSLEAFAQAALDVPTARASTSFTELELDGDSLLQAIETAAGRPFTSSASVSVSSEEALAAVDEPRLEPGALPQIPLFSDLPEDAFIALFEQCPLRRVRPGELIIKQGSRGESFFVICAGSAKVFQEGVTRREVATLDEGAFFGEMALLSDAARSASVEAASEDTQVLEISAEVLTQLSRQHPTIATALKKFCRQRLLSNLMNGATLFRPFTKSERRELVQKFRARDVGRGETLIHEGQRSDGLYVILTGEVAVQVRGQWVASLKEGEVFGEMSLLTRTPATATVQAVKKTSLLRLPREDFDTLIMSHPQILELVAQLSDGRERKNAELLKASATSIV